MRWKEIVTGVVVAVAMVSGCSQSPQAREAKYLDKAKDQYQKKNYAVAVLHLKNAIRAQPKDAEPYYQLGLAYEGLDDFARAAASFQKAVELNPKHTGAQLKLVLLMLTSNDKDVLLEAQKRSQEVLDLLPGDVDALDVLALAELRLGKPESAEAHLEQALKKSPGHLKSAIALAEAKLARKDEVGADAVLKEAAAQAPRSAEVRTSLGGYYFARGKTAEAEQEFRTALEIDPKYGPALLAVGAIEARAGHSDQAERIYQQLAALPDKQYKPLHAQYLFQSGKREQAVAEFEKLFQATPADRDLRTALVSAYLAVNRAGDAERVLAAALKKNGRDADALMQRSRMYLGSGKYADALTDLNRVLQFRPNSAEVHYLLSKAREGRGEVAMQQQELGEALRLDPNMIGARLELAQTLLAHRAAQQALTLLDEAPAEQKQGAGVVLQRNWTLLSLGRAEEARKGVDSLLASGKVPQALLQDAFLKMFQKDYTGARASAEGVLNQNPQETLALGVLFESYAAQKQTPTGLEKTREYAARQ